MHSHAFLLQFKAIFMFSMIVEIHIITYHYYPVFAIMETVNFTMDKNYSSTVGGVVLRGNKIILSKYMYVQVVAIQQ